MRQPALQGTPTIPANVLSTHVLPRLSNKNLGRWSVASKDMRARAAPFLDEHKRRELKALLRAVLGVRRFLSQGSKGLFKIQEHFEQIPAQIPGTTTKKSVLAGHPALRSLMLMIPSTYRGLILSTHFVADIEVAASAANDSHDATILVAFRKYGGQSAHGKPVAVVHISPHKTRPFSTAVYDSSLRQAVRDALPSYARS